VRQLEGQHFRQSRIALGGNQQAKLLAGAHEVGTQAEFARVMVPLQALVHGQTLLVVVIDTSPSLLTIASQAVTNPATITIAGPAIRYPRPRLLVPGIAVAAKCH
jgi:hypothetical protein